MFGDSLLNFKAMIYTLEQFRTYRANCCYKH